MTKLAMAQILKARSFLTSGLDDEEKWMRDIRCVFYAILFLFLFLPTAILDIISPNYEGDNTIKYIIIGMNYISLLLLLYMYVELLIDKTKVIWLQTKILITVTLIFSILAILLYFFNLNILLNLILKPSGIILFFGIHAFFVILYIRAILALKDLKSKKIAAIILIFLGITAIPVSALLETFGIFLSVDNYYYMFILMTIRSCFILAYIGLFMLADVIDLSSILKRLRYMLIILYTTLTIFLELIFTLAYAHERLENFFNNLYGWAIPVFIGWIFLIGLSIYKLEYKFDKGYLTFTVYFLRILSLFFGVCFILSLSGSSLIPFFIIR